MSEREEMITYKVVVNHEEQYSIWPADKENAPGWRDAGFSGNKADVLAYINEHWTDMRPLSLRLQMERDQQQPLSATPAATADTISNSPPATTDAVPVSAETSDDSKPRRGWFGRRR